MSDNDGQWKSASEGIGCFFTAIAILIIFNAPAVLAIIDKWLNG